MVGIWGVINWDEMYWFFTSAESDYVTCIDLFTM